MCYFCINGTTAGRMHATQGFAWETFERVPLASQAVTKHLNVTSWAENGFEMPYFIPFSTIVLLAKTHLKKMIKSWSHKLLLAHKNEIQPSIDLFFHVFFCPCATLFLSFSLSSVWVHSSVIYVLLTCHLIVCCATVQ